MKRKSEMKIEDENCGKARSESRMDLKSLKSAEMAGRRCCVIVAGGFDKGERAEIIYS